MKDAERSDPLAALVGVGTLTTTPTGGLRHADGVGRQILDGLDRPEDVVRQLTERYAADAAAPAAQASFELEVDGEGGTRRLRVAAAPADDGAEGLLRFCVVEVPTRTERRSAHLYEHSPVAMHSIDEASRICEVNRAWLQLMGYRRGDVIGRSAASFMTEESARRAREQVIPRFWREGSVRSVPYEYVRADGAIIEVELDCDVTRAPDGRRVSLSVVRDVTERNRALAQLEERERELRRLIERSPDGVLLHREGRVVFANPRLASLLGAASAEELVGEPVPPSLRDVPREAQEEAVLNEVRIERPDGSHRVADAARLAVHFEGRLTQAVLLRDLTERRTLQAKLAQADRLATVGTLAAGVAHEVNNPLTFVMHFVDHLDHELSRLREQVGGDEPPEALLRTVDAVQENTTLARDGCARVRDIIRDLKTFSRVQDGPRVPLDVNQALRSAIQMASHQVELRARIDVELGPLPAVRANDGRLCQVFLNLLLNAGQAIESTEGERGRVVVQTWAREGRVFVAVRDTGSGIAAAHLARLFEPFFSTKPARLGSGLGLWICREIVHELGGHIEVESQVGTGSTFTVVLPAAPRALAEPDPRPPSVPPPRPQRVEAHGERVLVVDDEPALRDLLAEALSERALVLTASSGDEARELLEHDDRFDAILCDVVMPGMDGIQLYGWIASDRPQLASRLVFMTGAACTPEARALFARIDNQRLDKPFRFAEVERALDRVGRRVPAG